MDIGIRYRTRIRSDLLYEQIPIPYALRRARFTARVSAICISAPRTCGGPSGLRADRIA
jgi:hypothetical protein